MGLVGLAVYLRYSHSSVAKCMPDSVFGSAVSRRHAFRVIAHDWAGYARRARTSITQIA